MTSKSPASWVLPVLAHLVVIIAAPFWFMIMVFSFLLFTGGYTPMMMLLFALYWTGPVISMILLFGLWHALYNQLSARVKTMSLSLIGLQLVAFIILFAAE